MVPRPCRLVVPPALALALALLPAPAPPGAAQELAAVDGQTTTAERLRSEPWWPRKSFDSAAGHAGSAACAECHGATHAAQAATPMARTLARAAPAHLGEVEAGAGAGEIELGGYRYRLERTADGLGFTVGDGELSLAAPVEWVFGAGETGYTYVWERDGVFYESRFSYFPGLGRFAATPGRLLGPPASLEMALGHALPGPEAHGCFSCHSTAMAAGDRLDPRRLTPGVTCEGCHGPGADHVALAKSGLGAGAIFDPGGLGPDGVVDFCGACHHTFWDVAVGTTRGIATARSPSYRLVRSRCWGEGDPRLTCISCHDAHRELERDAAAYDGACRTCHGASAEHAAPAVQTEPSARAEPAAHGEIGGDAGAAAHREAEVHAKPAAHAEAAGGPPPCPVGTERCVDCHMAKVELPEVHVESTDHWIRVVRPGEPFPE